MTYEHGLGRKPSPYDARDWPVKKLAAMVDQGEAVPVAWESPTVLNQNGYRRCVGYCGAGFKGCAQAAAGADATITDAEGDRLYRLCKILEGDPEGEDGAYMRSIAQVLKSEGVINAYAFADYGEAAEWVQHRGPVMLGINWYRAGMDRPDAEGNIRVSGYVDGGHAILWRGDEQRPNTALLRNSWGAQWGVGGDCTISDADLQRLLGPENGEAICAVRLTGEIPPPRWPDLPPMDLDDLLSQDATWRSGVMQGYTDGIFRPYAYVTLRQVGTVAWRIGAAEKNIYSADLDYVTFATRGMVHATLPMLTFKEERWDEPLTRYQLLLLVGRYLREKGL